MTEAVPCGQSVVTEGAPGLHKAEVKRGRASSGRAARKAETAACTSVQIGVRHSRENIMVLNPTFKLPAFSF